jgi:hypothetical protein
MWQNRALHIMVAKEAEADLEGARHKISPKDLRPNDLLPPTKSYLLKFSEPVKKAPPAGD